MVAGGLLACVLGSKRHAYLNTLTLLNTYWDVREFRDVRDLENTEITEMCYASTQILDKSPSLPGLPFHLLDQISVS